MTVRDRASFRDNSGFVFFEGGDPYRHVGEAYAADWSALKGSGLIEELAGEGLLIPHEEVAFDAAEHPGAIAIIRPEKVPFVSYPYEWSFSQLKNAALATLEIQKRALAKGLTLKDATAYNVQFIRRRPVFIDTLSFEVYREGTPWQAYRQFCRHFLAPLALRAKVHQDMGLLLRPELDGIPLDLASKALPFRTRFQPGLAMHLHMHAQAENRLSSGSGKPAREAKMSKIGLFGLVDSLRRTVEGFQWNPSGTVWADYYQDTNYSPTAMEAKRRLVAEFIGAGPDRPRMVWDLGANTGEFSEIAAEAAQHVVAFDIDPAAVERNYLKPDARPNVLPLIQDLTNPSPGLGWAHEERSSLAGRANADHVLALALIHHLAIGNNVPLDRIAEYFSRLAPRLVIEFVPKEDSQVQRLLSSRKDIFDRYSRAAFEEDFARYYRVLRTEPIPDSKRTLYLMERHETP